MDFLLSILIALEFIAIVTLAASIVSTICESRRIKRILGDRPL